MVVQVIKADWSVEIQYKREEDYFVWRVQKMNAIEEPYEPTPAIISGTRPGTMTAQVAREHAKRCYQAAFIAEQLDEAITDRADFKTVEVIEMEEWTDDTRVARITKRGGAVLVMIPAQSNGGG